MLFFTLQHHALAGIDVHCVDKLFLAIHALKLYVDIAATGVIVFLVCSTLFHDLSCFNLYFCDLFIKILLRFLSLVCLFSLVQDSLPFINLFLLG